MGRRWRRRRGPCAGNPAGARLLAVRMHAYVVVLMALEARVLGWAVEVEDERKVVLKRRHVKLSDGRHQGLPAATARRSLLPREGAE
jgi:hypothetical protein